MTLPRVLSLTSTDDGVRLVQKPVSEISTIRKETNVHQQLTVESNIPVSFDLNNQLMEIEIEFEQLNSSKFDLILQHSEIEKTTISYDIKNSSLVVDRTNSG